MSHFFLEDSQQTEKFGFYFARSCQNVAANSPMNSLVVYLEGDLGAGKTTLTRGILQGLGHLGAVKSPTYTLVEPYSLAEWQVYHFDLYRLADPEELEFLGIRDYLTAAKPTLLLFEWADKGGDCTPAADIVLQLYYAGQDTDDGRTLDSVAKTALGEVVLENLIEFSSLS